jgi:WD40 repeat protein
MTRSHRWPLTALCLLLAAGLTWGQQAKPPMPVSSPDGKRQASATADTIRVIDIATQRDLYRIQTGKGTITALAFSPDGKLLVGGSDDKMLRVFDGENGKEVRRIETKAAVASVNVSPDGKVLRVDHTDKTQSSWDMATGKQLQ